MGGGSINMVYVRIKPQHIDQLLRHGYAIVPSFLDLEELKAARENFLQYAPSWDEFVATPQRYSWVFDDPENLQIEFPFVGDALNQVTTHPDILALVEQLLGTSDILLSQSAIWPKYAGTGDFEQGLHRDYQGNTLVVPRDDGDYRQVNMILYYSDVDETMGPTYVVSNEQARDLPLWPPGRPRNKKNAKLYEAERPVLVEAGALLIFGMRTFHRASNITAPVGARFSHHLVYRAARHAFSGYHHYSHFGEKPEMQRFIERTTPRQREVLGFPKPSDPYWNPETRAAVALRYPGMDMTPYRD